MNRIEHRAKTPALTAGLIASVRALLGGRGGALPSPHATALCRLRARRSVALCAGLALLSVGLLGPAGASATFTRPFLRQLNGTAGGAFAVPRGVAVDAADNLLVGERLAEPPFPLHQFESAELGNGFLKTLEIESPEANVTLPESLAVDRSTGFLYLTGGSYLDTVSHDVIGGGFVEVFDNAGGFVKQFGPFTGATHVAVDNSTEPSAGTVYVASAGRVEKFSASGEPLNFSAGAEYISGNRISGPPGRFNSALQTVGIAVGNTGDIYLINQNEGLYEVRVYGPSGVLLHSIDGEETPGLAASHASNGFGGSLQGLAVDPLSGDLLVGVISNFERGVAAVDEFSSSGKYLDQLFATTPGQRLHSAFQIAADSKGDLYIVNSGGLKATEEHAVEVYGPGRFLPSLSLAEATQRKPQSALLSGSIDPEGLPLTACAFEYVTEAAFKASGFSDLASGGSAPCIPAATSIPADQSFHPVEAAITGLTSGATYRYRLAATSSGALGGTAQSSDLPFTAPGIPVVESTTAANLSSTFADLHARISPRGADTTYRFEYLTEAEFTANGESFSGPDSAQRIPVPDADIGSGGATGAVPANVIRHLGGLQPATVYRFRVTATNEVGSIAGLDASFATLPQVSPGLPDHRAYELVTPPNKGSAEDMFGLRELEAGEYENRDPGYASESGEAFFLETKAAFGPFPASGQNAYVFSRAPGAWQTTSLASPALGVQQISLGAFDPFDLSRVGIADHVGSSASGGGTRNTTLLGPPGGGPGGELYATLHTDQGESLKAVTEQTRIVGASHGLSQVVLETKDHTLAAAAAGLDEGANALYQSPGGGECDPQAANCALINVKSNASLLSPCGAILGLSHQADGTHTAVSADGSRVFFTAPDPYMTVQGGQGGTGCWNGATSNTPQLYLRSEGLTIEVSAPEKGVVDPSGRHPAAFVGAARDGSRVFFLTESELTKDDAGIHDPELYQWRSEGTGGCAEAKGCLSRVSRGESGAAAAHVTTVPALAADGSAVYFTATAQLTADAPATSGEGVNLYRYETEADSTSYIATLDHRRDYGSAQPGAWWNFGGAGVTAIAFFHTANWYTTPDGRYLLFTTTRELTGYGTVAPSFTDCRVLNGSRGIPNIGRCHELYRYDSANGDLACVSCNPSGAPPVSNAFFVNGDGAALASPTAGPPRTMSDNGSYVFFDTADPLVPADGNGTLDVYEWHQGNLSLISSGHDSLPSFFLGADPEGANVFLGTHSRLAPQDTDTAGDVYDARICTDAHPCIAAPPNKEGLCEGDACSHPLPAPDDPTPSSLSFQGAGNLHETSPSHKHHKKHRRPGNHRKRSHRAHPNRMAIR